MPNFALGLQYDYLRVARLPDKMHLHYIHPNITYRYLWSEGNQGAFLSFGIGYMNYQERTYQRGERNGRILFSERLLRSNFEWGLRVLILPRNYPTSVSCRYTHSRLVCKPRRMSFPMDYDYWMHGIRPHSWFKNNVKYLLLLGFAIHFGR